MKSSPILLVTVGTRATRDRSTIFICSGVGVATGLDPVYWLSLLLKESDIGSKERTAIELKTRLRGLW